MSPFGSLRPEAFVFVDTAIGGVDRRNQVMRADEFAPPAGAVDCYRTYLCYEEDLVAYVQANRTAAGGPSVAGYPGPSLARVVPLDFDSADDLDAALADVRVFVQRFCARFDVPPQAIRTWFSGHKGFSVEIPASLFGGFTPAPDTAARLKRLVGTLAEGLPTLDWRIYERVRLWRVENTRNGKSGLHKIPLTIQELLTLGVDEIRTLARAPRTIERVPDDEWDPRADLVVLWEEMAVPCRRHSLAAGADAAERRFSDAQANELVALIAPHWVLGQKHDLALCLAGYLAREGIAEEQTLAIVGCLAANDQRPDDRANAVRDTYCRLRDGLPSLGFAGLRQLVDLAALRALEGLIKDAEPEPTADEALAGIGSAAGTSEETVGKPPGAKYALTDLGNAERFVAQHRDDVRYCYKLGAWLVWDGARWAIDEGGVVHQLAKRTIRRIYIEAEGGVDARARSAIARHATRSEAAPRIDALLALARSEPGVGVTLDLLDRDPWVLNVRNGTLDLRTGLLRDHDRADLITKLAPVSYDPDAACPTFDTFLYRVMDGDPDLVAFLRRLVGYALTGDTSERVLFIFSGEGRNGKTTLLEVMRAVLGPDYALRTPTETLLARRDAGIPNDVARLRGARLISASEAGEGRRLDEAKIKDLTGGDTLAARFMRGEWFEFLPVFKLVLATNHKPVVRGTDDAIWDRICLVPFRIRIHDNELDPRLRDKLIAEAAGILTWGVGGCLEWQREGLGGPQGMRAAVAEYRTEMDVLGTFLTDCCLLGPDLTVSAKAFFAAYKRWCEETGERQLTQTAVGKRLGERGFVPVRLSGGVRTWRGLGLLSSHPTPPEPLPPTDNASPKVTRSPAVTRCDATSKMIDLDVEFHGPSAKTRHDASSDTNVSPKSVFVRPCFESGAPVPADRLIPYCEGHEDDHDGAMRCCTCGAALDSRSRSAYCVVCDPTTR